MLSQFQDSHKFKFINRVPIFIDNGSSYLSKLKNGLSLDTIIEMENYESNIETVISTGATTNSNTKPNSNLFDCDYTSDYYKHSRKGKYKNKISNLYSTKSNSKKRKDILDGNNYKLFVNNCIFQNNFQEEMNDEKFDDEVSIDSLDSYDYYDYMFECYCCYYCYCS